MQIRPYAEADWPALWSFLEPTFRAGDTYAYPRDMDEAQTRACWIGATQACWVAEQEGRLLGTCYLKPNQPGQGSHVCNAGYVVAPWACGRGAATALCVHSQEEARRLGYRAMQFNLVVSTNTGALQLWQRLGFEVVGRLPGAFQHPVQGEVDAFVLFKRLGAAPAPG